MQAWFVRWLSAMLPASALSGPGAPAPAAGPPPAQAAPDLDWRWLETARFRVAHLDADALVQQVLAAVPEEA